MPEHPLYASESYISKTTAFSPTFPLSVFQAKYEYDTTLLEYVSFTQSALFNPFTISTTTTATVQVLGNGRASSASEAAVTGFINPLVSITWKVKSTATAQRYAAALHLTVVAMEGPGSQTIFTPSDTYVTVESLQDASSKFTGEVQVAATGTELGIYAYLSNAGFEHAGGAHHHKDAHQQVDNFADMISKQFKTRIWLTQIVR